MQIDSGEDRFTALRMLEQQNALLMQQLACYKAETLRYKAQLDKMFAKLSQGAILGEFSCFCHVDGSTQTVEGADSRQPENAALRIKIKRLEAEREHLLSSIQAVREKQQVIEQSQIAEASLDSASLNESIGAQRANIILLSSSYRSGASYQLSGCVQRMQRLIAQVDDCLACAAAMCSCAYELYASTLRLDKRLDQAFAGMAEYFHAQTAYMSAFRADQTVFKQMELKLAAQRAEIIELQQARIEDIRRCGRIVDEMRSQTSDGHRYSASAQWAL